MYRIFDNPDRIMETLTSLRDAVAIDLLSPIRQEFEYRTITVCTCSTSCCLCERHLDTEIYNIMIKWCVR